MDEYNLGELVRKAESDYTKGTTQSSRYVSSSLYNTVETIDAYLNSKHTTGETDSLGREKPFFNIVVAASNIWYRATDIDRKHIKLRATKSSDYVLSLVMSVHLQEWMRKENFGAFLNEWGRVLARYGSAVIKSVENSSGLHMSVVPWNRLIVDSVDFDANPKIEILELTEAELWRRVETHNYNEEAVKSLSEKLQSRETIDRQKKDSKAEYIKLYEVHGMLPLSFLTGKEKDKNVFTQQMHVVSSVSARSGRKTDYEDFIVFSGEEAKDPYMITHLIKEDGRTLSIGAVEHLFDAQWMVNHSVKAIKDTLDIASKSIFQTADPRFVNRNVLTSIETGDIMIYTENKPLTQINTQSHDMVSWQNFAVNWKANGNEITGISDVMLGAQPKAGTAWRQTEALLTESYSLFELMTENKGFYIEEILRKRVIPHLKKKMDTSEEITATLADQNVVQLDEMYVPKEAIRRFNRRKVEEVLAQGENALTGGVLSPIQPFNPQQEQANVRQELFQLGGRRFYKPSDISDTTWKELLKDFEWEVEVDITGEPKNIQENLATLNTALQLVMNPAYAENKQAQMIVGKILEMSGAISPLELGGLPPPSVGTPSPIKEITAGKQLTTNERNIQ